MEIDLYGAAGVEVWMGESKWWRGRKVGRAEVEEFLRKVELVRKIEGEALQTLRVWFFSHDGFTEEAERVIRENGMLWSARDDLDGLLKHVGLRQLPKLVDEERNDHAE